MHQVRQIHQPPTFGMTSFQGLTATQWRNRINEYNPGMYSKEFLKDKTVKELAQIQNGKSYSPPRPSPCREGSRGGSVG